MTASSTTSPLTMPTDADRWISFWLFSMVAMVAFMVVLGGATRLTESGLSMVHWRPFTGWLPPMSEGEWLQIFDAYKQYPEYQDVNLGMTLDEFKNIFWLEYLHRLWGRFIGIAFALPLLVFVLLGWIRGLFALKMVGLLILGGLQGVMGWYMVKSGLVDRPDVSQYRLAAHLGLAFLIAGLLLWVGLAVRYQGLRQRKSWGGQRLSLLSKTGLGLSALVFLTVLSGALVAGLNAGLIYNTFPLMDGRLPPADYLSLNPLWLNIFEDVPSVQFHHRVLAVFTLGAILLFCWRCHNVDRVTDRWPMIVAIAVILQVCLGIATLVMVVPMSVAIAHQGGALIVFLSLIALSFFRNDHDGLKR